MRTFARSLVAAASVLCAGSAGAAELSGADITALVSGNSIYIETSAASITGVAGQGVLYYMTDGTSLYKTPKGETWHGKWSVKDNTICTDWKESPGTPCSKYDKQGDTVSIVNATTGQVRAKILKTAPGNAEKIAP